MVYICGVQAVRPPLIELERLFSKEGAAAVPYLVSKLEDTLSGETVTDVLRVFLRMQAETTYSLTRDEDLSRIEARVKKLGIGAEKRSSEEIMAKLRSGE